LVSTFNNTTKTCLNAIYIDLPIRCLSPKTGTAMVKSGHIVILLLNVDWCHVFLVLCGDQNVSHCACILDILHPWKCWKSQCCQRI